MKMLKAVFFDLDGTLLPMDEKRFLEIYFGTMGQWMTERDRNAESFIGGVIAGTRAMYQNNGEMTNEEIFWKSFEPVYGPVSQEDKRIMDEYYDDRFRTTLAACGHNPEAKKIVEFCRDRGLKVVLATNPLFPRIATLTRMGYTDLSEDDFDYVTAYENSSYTKPNPAYFTDLLEKFGLSADEVIHFGNNTFEDGECSLGAGIKCYIIETKDLIESDKATHDFERIKMDEVIPTIEKHLA